MLSASLEHNFQETSNFRLSFNKFADFTYYMTDVMLPDLSIGRLDMNSPFLTHKIPGTSIEFSDLMITFLVDESLYNYKKLFHWLVAMKELHLLKKTVQTATDTEFKEITSTYFADATLTILTNNKNQVQNVYFHDCWPNALSGLTFSTRGTGHEIITCDATFCYSNFEFEE